LFASCSALKFLPKGEKLYTGTNIQIAENNKNNYTQKAKKEAREIASVKPNTSFVNMRPSLWLFYKTEKYEKGWKNWINTKLAQKPVYASMVDPNLISLAIDARLHTKGYFDAQTTFEWQQDSTYASLKYTVLVSKPYVIKEINYPNNPDSISKAIQSLKATSFIKTGTQYDLELLKKERNRIEEALKETGFYFFNNEYLLFKTDTTIGNREIKIDLVLKPETPFSASLIYVIDEVNIFPNFQLGNPNKAPKRIIDSVNYYSLADNIKPKPIIESVFIRNNKQYSHQDHNLTLSRLSNLGVFKFVNVRIDKQDSAITNNKLRANILLTPFPEKSLTLEIQGVTKSNNFVGPGLTLSHRNRNFFNGAELLVLNLKGSFETQFNGPYKGQSSYEITPSVALFIPRFMLPFPLRTNSLYVPRTKFTLDFSYLSRVNYYNINSINFAFGYKWKQRLTIDHDLSVVNINYFNIYNLSTDFLALLEDNPTLALRYEKQFIEGITYSFFYNQQVLPKKRNPIYVNANIDLAGSVLSGIKSLSGQKANTTNSLEIFGVKYAQYIRVDVDLRKYFTISNDRKKVIATRLFAGWGLPFGNASIMPYTKQYFSGGAYSLRGFPVYSIGPGTYTPPDSLQSLYFVQQGGEIKLEGNVEYRFAISGMVKGAFFADAGNTWLNNDNADIPGGKFEANTFMNQLAVSIGTGIRIDVQFFVFRLDLGIPVRKPWLTDGQRWVFNSFDLGSSAWRNDNLIFNLAFGYPF
jgi:outer membrane protein assembly factor BamA